MTQATTRPKGLHIMLWIAQVILGGMFIMAGFMKSATPIAELSVSLPWAAEVPEAFVRFIGISELAGGIGLLLPSLLRIKPKLTPYAALGLATIMVLAIFFHISKGEFNVLAFNIVLCLLAVFIAWGRLKKAPIYAKS